ncbi:hypothetical protein ETB97_004091 [Aspergillus alliaceus]|uniref:WW domain-containing protein n=1 Tax=Petromyces alliaceus TaxID=209559 RepID=A0A8H6AHE8_PETAA|nr:hypothetical protein ETB97_004091 [Aspergillus burnettii]
MDFVSKLAEKFLDKDKSSGSQEGYGSQGGYGGQPSGYGGQGGYAGQPEGYSGRYPHQQQHSGPQVPPPWVARWDDQSQRWFYVNEQTGERTWNHPGQGGGYGQQQQQPSYGGGAPYGGGQSYGQQPSYGYSESRQGEYYQQHGPKKDHTGAKIAGAAALGVAGGALGMYAAGEMHDSYEEHKEEWKQDVQDFPENAAEWTGEKVGEAEAGWDHAEDRVEQGWDNTVDKVEDIPENVAEWTGEKVGSVERFGDNMHDAYERGEDEGRGDDW